MVYSRTIEEAIQKLAGTYLKDIVAIIQCTVSSVDTNALTCDCIPLSDYAITDIPGVQLSAEVSDGLVVFPTIGSTVYVALTTRNKAFLLITSDLDKVQVSIPNGTTPQTWTKLLISSSGIEMNDGSYGGLVEVVNLVTKLNNIENKIDALITAFNSWTPVPNDGGAALKTALASWVSTSLTPTVRADIENTLITHGK